MNCFEQKLLRSMIAGGETDERAAAYVEFMSAMHRHRFQEMKRFRHSPLHPGQAAALFLLEDGEEMTQRELAQALDVSTPTVNVMLGKMKRRGLIETRSDRTDRRCTRVFRTECGREMIKTFDGDITEALHGFSGNLTTEENRVLAGLLAKVCRPAGEGNEE